MEAAHDRLGTRRRREAARGSPREHEFTADTSYKIDACLSAAAQAKKNRSTQNGAKTRTTKPGGSTERFPGPHAMRRRVRRVGAAAAHSAPTRLQRCQTARRCGGAHASAGCPTRTTRIRTPRTTPGTRHTQ